MRLREHPFARFEVGTDDQEIEIYITTSGTEVIGMVKKLSELLSRGFGLTSLMVHEKTRSSIIVLNEY